MSKVFGQIILTCFFLFLAFYGAWIGGIVYKEPDICFLLASGRWIVEHGQLPVSDPFSWTTGYHHQPYVIEKWLTEIIFYQIYKLLGGVGLVIFDACVLTLTFVVIPTRICALSGISGLRMLGIALLCALTSFCHLALRPEIFSFLIIAIYIEQIIRHKNSSLDWRTIAWIVILMALWSNLHTLFIVGLMMLMLMIGCQVVAKIFLKSDNKDKSDALADKTYLVAFVLAVVATLVNPYGVTLWAYLPNIFGPFNDTNAEMQPMGMQAFKNPTFYPFDLLIAISLYVFLRSCRTKPKDAKDLFFRVLIPAGILGGIKTIRTIPVSDLFISGGITQLAQNVSKVSKISESIDNIVNPRSWLWAATCLVFAGLGTYGMTTMIPPAVPQESTAFKPPLKAIRFIEAHKPSGNLLNDPHFGAVMMWEMKDNPPVFIDPRYNLYGNDLLQDYWTMALCRDGWQTLLDKYKIGWIFLPPDLELCKKLSQNSDWQVSYKDERSFVIERIHRGTTTTP